MLRSIIRKVLFAVAAVVLFLPGCVVVPAHPHGAPPGQVKKGVVVVPGHVVKPPRVKPKCTVELKIGR